MILNSGSALGFNNGPLLVSKGEINTASLATARIAIPGRYTTANMLFSIAWPEAVNKKEYLFSEIEDAVLRGEADAGLIIHESRFTYEKKGLRKIADMGEFWEKLSGLPIVLGMIVINRRIPSETTLAVNRVIQRSVEFALRDPAASQGFVSENAREMGRDVMRKHIELYVNKFTVNLGQEGRKAVTELYRIAAGKGIIPVLPQQIFPEIQFN
jgi:1,4-dihydroxy-6-naphthoate synthase